MDRPFYKEKGYIPSLASGEQETVPEVNSFEKRQSVAVTLGTAYDQWCLSRIASALGLEKEADHYVSCSYNYRNLFNPQTSFFHPKDKDGRFLEPFDYRFSGGLGAREYYGENNGWIYRWDVQHNFGDLVNMMGGLRLLLKTWMPPSVNGWGNRSTNFTPNSLITQEMWGNFLWLTSLLYTFLICTIMHRPLGKPSNGSVRWFISGFGMI